MLISQTFLLLLDNYVLKADIAVMQSSLMTFIEANTYLENELRHKLDIVRWDVDIYVDIEFGYSFVYVSACFSVLSDL